MTSQTIFVNSLITIFGGLYLFSYVIRQIPFLPEKNHSPFRLLAHIFLFGLIAGLVVISAGITVPPENFYEKFFQIFFFIFIIGGIPSFIGLSILLIIIVFQILPSNFKKIFAILIFISSSMLILGVLNSYFDLGWNFPDIFGLPTGFIIFAFFLYDRYLIKQKSK